MKPELATLGGGCFWCLEPLFSELRGVLSVESGYAGGHTSNPTYREVCSGATGHAEVVQIEYDADQINFSTLLKVFFTAHDPTTLNRQGADSGTQYRSVVFFHNEEQRIEAGKVIQEAQAWWPDPIVTELAPLIQFYKAEAWHQDYYNNNPYQPYCFAVISPKVKKIRAQFADLLK